MLNVFSKNLIYSESFLFHHFCHSNKYWFCYIKSFFFVDVLHITWMFRLLFFLLFFLLLLRRRLSHDSGRLCFLCFIRWRWTWTCILLLRCLFIHRRFIKLIFNDFIFIIIFIFIAFCLLFLDFFFWFFLFYLLSLFSLNFLSFKAFIYFI